MMTNQPKTHPLEKNVRLPTTERVKNENLPRFRLTKRDIKIIESIYTHRALTTPQINALLFSSKLDSIAEIAISSRCRKRLKLLYHAGYLYRDEQPTKLSEGRKPLVYFLDSAAIPILIKTLDVFPEDIDWKPAHNNVTQTHFLGHLLATNDVRIAIQRSCMQNGFSIETWVDDRTLHSDFMKDTVTVTTSTGRRVKQTFIPDGYFLLTDGEYNYHHFLEVDMGTETRKKFAQKIRRYMAYYQNGRYQERYGSNVMRVLTVTTSQKRMLNLKSVTENEGGNAQYWFSTFQEVTPANVLTSAIWQVAGFDGEYTFFDERLHSQ